MISDTNKRGSLSLTCDPTRLDPRIDPTHVQLWFQLLYLRVASPGTQSS